MTEQGNPNSGERQAPIESLPPLVKAYIDEQVENAIRQHDQAQTKVKKWRNSWRSAGPITKASFWMTAFIAAGTIAYAITAWRELDAMKSISADNTRQTQQLIDAANQIKTAAFQFKGSAQGIDGNIGNAVGKLQAQTDKMDAARVTSEQESQKALQATGDAIYLEQRPWVGVQISTRNGPIAGIITGPRQGVNSITILAVNTGRTPALKWRDFCCEEKDQSDELPIPNYEALRNDIDSHFPPEERERIRLYPNEIEEHRKWWRDQLALRDAEAPFAVIPPNGSFPLNSTEINGPSPTYHYSLGKMTYGDPIHPTVQHVTYYCLVTRGNEQARLCMGAQDEQ